MISHRLSQYLPGPVTFVYVGTTYVGAFNHIDRPEFWIKFHKFPGFANIYSPARHD